MDKSWEDSMKKKKFRLARYNPGRAALTLFLPLVESQANLRFKSHTGRFKACYPFSAMCLWGYFKCKQQESCYTNCCHPNKTSAIRITDTSCFY